MKEATGNLWTYPADVVVITVNGFVKANGACVMGRGCAREARNAFPGIDKHLGRLINTHGNRAFNLGIWEDELLGTHRIASYPTKHRWDQNSDPELIWMSAQQLADMADKFGWERIVMPRPGCGNGGLKWEDVKPLIEKVLDDRFTVITH